MIHNRVIVCFIALILILGAAFTAKSQSDVTVTTTDNAQLRSGPGREFNSLAVVPYNTTLPATGRNEDSSWVQVNFNGTSGWVATFLLSWTGNLDTLPVGGVVTESPPGAAAPPPPPPGSVTATNTNAVNVRAAPNTGAAQLGQLAPGTTVGLNGRWGSGRNMWVRFDFDGRPAWAAGWLLTITGDANALTDVEAAQNAVLGVCSGGAAPEAAPYNAGAGTHPVVLLNETGGRHAWNSQLGRWGVGSSLGAAELVGCVSAEQVVSIETCHYFGPDIVRYVRRVNVRLVAAQTGQVVASISLEGSHPRNCRQQEPYNLTRLDGGSVSLQQLLDWLRPFVSP